MARKKKNTKGTEIAQAIMEHYQPKTKEDMQEALKEIFGPMFETMLQGELKGHLGYEASEHGYKDTDNRRNGYTSKHVKTSYGQIPVDVPRDRDGSFEPQLIPKRTRDVSGIEDKVISMYAKGLSQRDISDTIEDIYGFSISHETISEITDKVLDELTEWQIYGAASLKAAEGEFERFRQTWSQYPGAIDVWERNWGHVAQLFQYGSAVRRVMYTTNAIESVNSSFRKVTRKGAFPHENALLKLLYLRVTELYKKWKGRPVPNWAMLRNQLSMDPKMNTRMQKYEDI